MHYRTSMEIPQRPLGETGVLVSALGLGGYHVAMASSEREGIRIVHAAIDAGVTSMDNAWEYLDGKSEQITAHEGLRYAMSLPVATTVSGIDSMEVLRAKPESGRRVQADVRTTDEHAAPARPGGGRGRTLRVEQDQRKDGRASRSQAARLPRRRGVVGVMAAGRLK